MASTATQATPIEAVNATSTNTTEPAKAPAAPQRFGHDALDNVLESLNQKYGGDQKEFASLGEIADKVTREAKEETNTRYIPPAKKPAPIGTASPEQPEGQTEPKPVPVSKKYTVEGKEYELTPEQAERFAQKGIFYEKKGVALAQRERALQEKEAAASRWEQDKAVILKALQENPGAVLEDILGERAFEAIKPWATQKVQKLQEYEKNPQQLAIDQAIQGQRAAEQRAAWLEQQHQQREVENQTQTLKASYEKTIIDALEAGGIPKTDFTAAEMAKYMQIGLDKGVEYTPQQLAEIVKEDNTIRIRASLGELTNGLEAARKSGDLNKVVQMGDRLAEYLGDDVVYALAKYHLTKLKRGQPMQPKQVLSTPVKPQSGNGQKGYMKWDDWESARKQRVAAMERGENVPEWT